MKARDGRSLVLAAVLALGACTSGSKVVDAPPSSAPTSSDADTTAPNDTDPGPAVQDVMELGPFAPLEPETYFIDPDLDPATPLRVVYEVPFEGWSMWIGAAKSADDGHVMVSITTRFVTVRTEPGRPSLDRSLSGARRRQALSTPGWTVKPLSAPTSGRSVGPRRD